METPAMKKLGTIENCPIWEDGNGIVSYRAKAAIDSDGSDNRHHDPCWQADTSLHLAGHPIDAESVPYIVVPPLILQGVKGIVLGCRALVTHIGNARTVEAVVADIGPRRKLGELSCECARRLGLDGDPNHGGTEDKVVSYTLFPGIPAKVDGILYALQPMGG
jgi:hypothetical protein